MIKLKGLHKWFGGHHVLNDVNLEIMEGETLVIIGRSGVGKSVLLKLIAGILEPDQGDIYVDGTNIRALDSKQIDTFRLRLGMLFQGAALFDSLDVQGNVGFSLYEHTKLSEKEISATVKEKLALVGMQNVQHLMPAELSGGMKKRVGLARAICNDPKIILYDEPTTGLDPINSDVINNLILRMKQKLGVTSVVVTHDMTSAYKVANRIAMLHEGRIIGVGTVAQIQNTTDRIIRQFITGTADPEV